MTMVSSSNIHSEGQTQFNVPHVEQHLQQGMANGIIGRNASCIGAGMLAL